MSLSEAELRMLGGSDAAAVAGVHPNKTPLDVFRRVVLGHVEPETAVMRRGNLMEPVIREMARVELGLDLLGPRRLRDPKRDFLRASLDDVAKGADSEEVVEYKSVSPWAADSYGTDGDAVPQHHLCQVQFYMGMSGLPRARLIALIGVDDLRQFTLTADAELQGMLFEAVEKFHRDHVLTGRPPPLDGSESCSEWLTSRFPKPKLPAVQATPEAEQWVREYRTALAEAEAAQARRDRAKNALKEFIGEASGASGDGWKIAWSYVNGRKSVDWAAVAAEAGVSREVIEKHTTAKAGYRAFRPSWRDNE